MHDEEIIQRMTRLLQKEIFEELTTTDRKELEDWLKTDIAHRKWYNQMKSLNFVKENHQHYKRITDPEQAWKRLEDDMSQRRRLFLRVVGLSSAAMIVVIFCFVFLLKKENASPQEFLGSSFQSSALISLIVDRGQDSLQLVVNENIQLEEYGLRAGKNTLMYDTSLQELEKMEFHTLTVGRGGEYRLTLSDGTVVWLNSESSLRYPIRFVGEQREVELWGEAFFEVNHDERKPFRVKSGNFEVEVLGTSFDIMNYEDEQFAQVTLASGKLRVNKGDQHTIIHPNQQVQLGEKRFDVREVDARYYTSWTDNRFMFDDESLDVIMRKLARWYNLDFEFCDTALMNTCFSGQLFKYKDITKAFELLELTTDVNFSINDKKILIMRKKL